MFTVEFDHDNIEITVLDDTDGYEDLKVDAFDDIVYIRQWNEDLGEFNVVVISPKMWEELIAAVQGPEGSFVKR